MTTTAGGERTSRTIEAGGRRYRATVAWRGTTSGRGLLYFVALGEEGPDDDREDRRVPLGPGRGLEEVSDEELVDLLSDGRPLTGTERRFRAPDGRLWLAQSVGPVWADDDPAEGSTALLFTSLEGEVERLRGPGVHAGRVGEEELRALWRRAAAPEGGNEEDGSARGDGDDEA